MTTAIRFDQPQMSQVTPPAGTREKAMKVLGSSYDATGKTDADLRLAAVVTKLGHQAVGKPDEYLNAALDQIHQDLPVRADTAHPQMGRLGSRTPEQQARSDAARDAYIHNLTGG